MIEKTAQDPMLFLPEEMRMEEFRRSMTLVSFPKGAHLYQEEDPVTSIFYIYRGKIKIYKTNEQGRKVVVLNRQEKNLIGISEAVLKIPSINNIQTMTKVSAVAFSAEDFRRALHTVPGFSYTVLEKTAAILRDTMLKVSGNTLNDCEHRLCWFILQKQHDGVFTEHLTDMCDLVGYSYRHLHRMMQDLCARGILIKEGTNYRIADGEALRNIAAGKLA